VQHHDTGADVAGRDGHEADRDGEVKNYLRFGGMIVTAMLAMYALTYLNSMELGHVRWSETRAYMTLLMGGVMALIMLAFMLSMYRNWKWNAVIVGVSVVLFGAALFLVRSQATVQDGSFMRAMIPHHSIAILTSERSDTSDVRVCELQVAIIEAQRREIAEMDWLIEDIAENGVAATPEQAEQRPVPEFEGHSDRSCPSG
jgi:hypothetical protein